MNNLLSFNLFESANNDVLLSQEEGKLIISINSKKYTYQISVETGPFDVDVELDKIVKNMDGSYKITASKKGLKYNTFLSKERTKKILDEIYTSLSKTGEPPVEIKSPKEKEGQKSFILSRII